MSGKRKDSKNVVLKTGETQRKDGTYSYRWTDPFKKRHDIYAKTLKELRGKEKDIEKSLLAGIDYSKRNVTFGELFEEWLSLKAIKDSTKYVYKNRYKYSIKPYFENLRIVDINLNMLNKFFKTYIETVSPNENSFIIMFTIINQVLQNAVDMSIIEKNPAPTVHRKVAALLVPSEKKPALTKTEESLFFNFAKNYNPEFADLLSVLLNTGMRAGELAALKWCDIDMEQKLIHIRHTVSRSPKIDISSPKTKQSVRTIPMNDTVYKILEKLKLQNKKCNQEFQNYNDFIFLNKRNNVYTTASIDRVIDVLISKYNETANVKLPKFGAHIFRHTFATRMNENNVNPKTIQAFLGHSTIVMTMDTYTSITTDKMKEDIESVTL